MDKKENEKEIKQEEKRNKKKIPYKIIIPTVAILLVIAIVCALFIPKKGYIPKTFNITKIVQKSKREYVGNKEIFVVETEKGSLEEIKKHLYIEPAISYDIKQVTRDKYEVITQDIPSDSIINFKYLDNKVVENKWAFQSTKDLTVTSVYPANNTSSNSTMTSIEITFSYPNVKDINNSVTIDPPVEGKFVQYGRVWILKPEKPLQENTTYTISINDKVSNGDIKLKEAYKSTFSTYASQNTSTTKITLNGKQTNGAKCLLISVENNYFLR